MALPSLQRIFVLIICTSMVLLQEAIAAGFILIVALGVILIIGVPLISYLLLRKPKNDSKQQAELSAIAQGQAPENSSLNKGIKLFTAIIIATLIVLGLFLIGIFILDKFIVFD